MKPGDALDRYVIEDVIGEGGMSVVYRARHARLRSLHAIKVLQINAPSVRRRLLLEGRVQASLKHPNVVAVTDVIEKGDNLALVMEFVDGPTLHELLRAPIPLDNALELFRGILTGIAAAHHAGLVHRDLKPANVLLAHTNVGTVPKVTDFGLVKVLQEEGTRTGAMMGTPNYMSPEQVKDASSVDHRADLWSLGVILYEMLTAISPFAAENVLGTYNKIATGSLAPITDLLPELPERVVTTVNGLLQADPNERLQTADEVLAALYGEEALQDVVTGGAQAFRHTLFTPQGAPERLPRSPGSGDAAEADTPPSDPDASVAQDSGLWSRWPASDEALVTPPGKRRGVAMIVVALGFAAVGGLVLTALAAGLLQTPTPGAAPLPPPAPQITPPTPAPAPRTLRLHVDAPVDRVILDEHAIQLIDGVASADAIRPGMHVVLTEAGTCPSDAAGCSLGADTACPPGCASMNHHVLVPAGVGPLDIALSMAAPAAPPSASPAPSPSDAAPAPSASPADPPPRSPTASPSPSPSPQIARHAAPADPPGATVSAAAFGGWLMTHPAWEPERAIADRRANRRYLRNWTPDPPRGPLTHVPWDAAVAYCASRGGLLSLTDTPTTWSRGTDREWRQGENAPIVLRRDGRATGGQPHNRGFSDVGFRCRR